MTAPPWHFRPVAILSLIWHLIAALDYLMVKLRVTPYLAYFTEAQIDYFTGMPLWADLFWAIGVWAGLLGAVLLWQRHGRAALLFSVSFSGLATLTAGLSLLRDPSLIEMTGPVGLGLMLVAMAVAGLFYLYARALKVRDRQR